MPFLGYCTELSVPALEHAYFPDLVAALPLPVACVPN